MAEEEADQARQLHQLRLMGVGTLVSGMLVTVVGTGSSKPYGILIVTLGFLGISALVLEQTQGATTGISIGFLTGGVIVWLWPYIGTADTDYAFMGILLAVVGLLNVVAAPITLRLRRFGERLGNRTRGE